MSLIEQYRTLHREGKFLGLSVLKFADEIGELIKQYGCETVLDYGSGQGHQYMPPHSLDKKWGASVTCYDPAVYGMQHLPDGPFDMVLCSDVLEHLPEDEINSTLDKIFARASKIVFLTVCHRPAKKKLPDGRNVHLTVQPKAWWLEKIRAAALRSNEIMGRELMSYVLRETP